MLSSEIYPYDEFFTILLDLILEDAKEIPVHREIFGIPLTYTRTIQKDGDLTISWTYLLSRDNLWTLTMPTRPSEAESQWRWQATGDLEAARRDLTLLKVAVT